MHPERFLIVKPSSLGDIIHAFPAVTLLKKHHPDAVFDWLAVPAFEELVCYHPAVRRGILFHRKEMGKVLRFPGEFRSLLRDLRQDSYDAVLDLQGLLRSALIGRCAKSELYCGPAAPREKTAGCFYTRKLDAGPIHAHAVLKNLRMAADFLGVPVPEEAVFEFPVRQTVSERAASMAAALNGCHPRIAVAPGARWKTKEWPPEFFAAAAEEIRKRCPDAGFLIIGTPGERAAGETFAKLVRGKTVNLAGKTTLPELVETIRQADLLLCNDSGPMHIAAALRTPVIPVFGPTDPVLTGPWPDNRLVLTPDLNCIRCFRRECSYDPPCHRAVSPERIPELIEQYHLLS